MFLTGDDGGWFRRIQHISSIGGVLQEGGDFTWRVSDCEELVGVI